MYIYIYFSLLYADLVLARDGSMVAGSPVCLARCGFTRKEIENYEEETENNHNVVHDSGSDKR